MKSEEQGVGCMDEARSFQILGILPTKDEAAIKAAYREKLVHVNPEDDPEGFKQLRQAYEAACTYARSEQETEKEEDLTPSGLWLKEVEAVYIHISRRRDAACWKELLAAPVLVDLEEEEACTEKLLRFLMDHFRLPADVWKLLDERFHLVENREKLYETYPRDFVDFAVGRCKQGDDMAYELFEGPEDANYDLFMRSYFDCLNAQDADQKEAAARAIEQAETLGIYHPHLEAAKAIQMEKEGHREEALAQMEALYEKYPQDVSIPYQMAELYFRCNKADACAAIYEKLKAENNRHYMANYRLTRYYYDQGAYEKAKRCAEEVMRNPLNDEFQELVKQINVKLEATLEEEVAKQPENVKKRLELGWCYLQDDKPQKGLELWQDRQPDAENEREYESLMAKTKYALEDYAGSKEHLLRWLPLLEKAVQTDSPEEKERDLGRMGTAHWMLSHIYKGEARENPDSFEKAIAEVDAAMELDASMQNNYLYEKALLLNGAGRPKEALAICDRLLAEFRFWPAYVAKQEAFETLRDAGGVIDCYHALKDLYPNYIANYEKAAEVYWQLDRLDDLKTVLDEAKENQAASVTLDLYRCKQLRSQADSQEKMTEALTFAKSLEESVKKDQEKGVIAQLFAEIAYCLQKLKNYDEALEYCKKAMGLDSGNPRYCFDKAEVLQAANRLQEAETAYGECEKAYQNNAYYYERLGECYRRQSKLEKAIGAYERSVEISPNQPYVYEQLMRICNSKIYETEDLTWYERGKMYGEKLVAANNIAYNYWLRGLLHLRACGYEAAEQDFKKAIEMEESWEHYNDLGCVYKYTGRFEEAVECFKKAMALKDQAEDYLAQRNLGDTYERMGKLQEALECYQQLRQLYEGLPDRKEELTSVYRDLRDVYKKMKRFDEALTMILLAEGTKTLASYKEQIGLAVRAEEYGKAERLIEKAAAMKGGMNIWEKSARQAWIRYAQGHFRDALELYKTALQAQKYNESPQEDSAIFYERCAYCCFKKGKTEQMQEYGKNALAYFEKQPGGIEKKAQDLYYRKQALYELVTAYAYAGDMEKAKAYLEKLESAPMCRSCTKKLCVDEWEVKALLAEMENDRDTAVKLLTEVMESDPLDVDVRMKLAQLCGPSPNQKKEKEKKGWFFKRKK